MRYEVVYMGYEAGGGGGGVSPAKPSEVMWGYNEERKDFQAASDLIAVKVAAIIVQQSERPSTATEPPRLLRVVRKATRTSRRRVLFDCR